MQSTGRQIRHVTHRAPQGAPALVFAPPPPADAGHRFSSSTNGTTPSSGARSTLGPKAGCRSASAVALGHRRRLCTKGEDSEA
jgi:hypothetical protein